MEDVHDSHFLTLKGVAAGKLWVHEATNLVLRSGNAFVTDLEQDTSSDLDIKLDDILPSNCSQDWYDRKSGMILCAACGEIVDLLLYDKHHSKCSGGNDYRRESSEGNSGDTNIEIIRDMDAPDLNNCKSGASGCVFGGPSEDCLCAHLRSTVYPNQQYYEKILSPNENINSVNTQSNLQQFAPCGLKKSITPSCDNCKCRSKLQYNNFGDLNNMPAKQSIPKICCSSQKNTNVPDIEYKIDGSIKLKDTFDLDIEIFGNLNAENIKNIEQKKTLESFKSNIVPLNSCKAVLGKCIVSGNGTISEECLCAKMLDDDDEQVTAAEIDEITPQPVIS